MFVDTLYRSHYQTYNHGVGTTDQKINNISSSLASIRGKSVHQFRRYGDSKRVLSGQTVRILICFTGVLNMLKTMPLIFFENSEKIFNSCYAVQKLLITFEVIIVTLSWICFNMFNYHKYFYTMFDGFNFVVLSIAEFA